MDSAGVLGFVAGVALVGALCGLSALGAVVLIAFRRIDKVQSTNARLEELIQQLATKTKAIDPAKAALDDERDFQEALMGTDLMMGYIGRKSPGALKQLWERHAPQQFLKGRRVN